MEQGFRQNRGLINTSINSDEDGISTTTAERNINPKINKLQTRIEKQNIDTNYMILETDKS